MTTAPFYILMILRKMLRLCWLPQNRQKSCRLSASKLAPSTVGRDFLDRLAAQFNDKSSRESYVAITRRSKADLCSVKRMNRRSHSFCYRIIVSNPMILTNSLNDGALVAPGMQWSEYCSSIGLANSITTGSISSSSSRRMG